MGHDAAAAPGLVKKVNSEGRSSSDDYQMQMKSKQKPSDSVAVSRDSVDAGSKPVQVICAKHSFLCDSEQHELFGVSTCLSKQSVMWMLQSWCKEWSIPFLRCWWLKTGYGVLWVIFP